MTMLKAAFSRLSPRWALVLGLCVREAFSFWTGHPYDLEVWVRNAYYVAHGTNPYTYMDPAPGLSFAYLGVALPSVGYLPPWSLVVAGLYWIYTFSPVQTPFLLYFLLKQPPILGDVGLGLMLYRAIRRWGGSEALSQGLFRFWMVFPYSILISAIWGQFDAIVSALILASLLAAGAWRRSMLDAVGILLKVFPVLFVPYRLVAGRGPSRWVALAAVAIPGIVTYLTFIVFGWGFTGLTEMLTFSAHGNPGGLSYARILVPYGASVAGRSPFLLALGAIWIGAVVVAGYQAARRFSPESPQAVVQASLLITAVFFLTRWGVNEQYLMYLIPLQLVDVALWHPERRSLLRFTWVLGLVFLIVNNILLIRFVAPVYPPAVDLDYYIDNVSVASFPRGLLLDALAFLFSAHVLQLLLVVLGKATNTTPWLVRAVRAVRVSVGQAIRGTAGDP